jgi:hypothetical protein
MAYQRRTAQPLGWMPAAPGNAPGTLALNTAQTQLAYGFVPDRPGLVLKEVRAFLAGAVGRLDYWDVLCDLCLDNGAGAPGQVVETRMGPRPTLGLSPGAGSSWLDFSSAAYCGTQYWLVFRNKNPNPGINYPTFQWSGQDTVPYFASGSTGTFGWLKQHTTTAPGGWGNVVTSCGGWRVRYADGSTDGAPFCNTFQQLSDTIQGARELGVSFILPGSGVVNIKGAAAYLAPVIGTPTAGLCFRLYRDAPPRPGLAPAVLTGRPPSLIATSPTLPAGLLNVPGSIYCSFSRILQLPPGTFLRLTLGMDPFQPNAPGNAYSLHEYTWDPDPGSLDLRPLGTLAKTAFDGDAWTDTPLAGYAMALIPAQDQEFSGAEPLPTYAGPAYFVGADTTAPVLPTGPLALSAAPEVTGTMPLCGQDLS